jgi:hypothetical protein
MRAMRYDADQIARSTSVNLLAREFQRVEHVRGVGQIRYTLRIALVLTTRPDGRQTLDTLRYRDSQYLGSVRAPVDDAGAAAVAALELMQ